MSPEITGMTQIQTLPCSENYEFPPEFSYCIYQNCLSKWPRGLRRRSTAARLLRSWVRIPPGAWMFVCCECCVLSGRGLCDGLITRPEESYRLWRVVLCDQETSNEEAKARYGAVENTTKRVVTPGKQTVYQNYPEDRGGGGEQRSLQLRRDALLIWGGGRNRV